MGVPEDRVSGWGADDLVRLPKELEDTHYRVLSRPGVPVSELE